MSTNTAVTHYSGSVADEALCGAEWSVDWDVTALKTAVTCPACLAELAELERPAIACSSMHEHDDVACAAPSSAEMTLDVLGARLAELHARIEAVFENDTDRQYALEGAQHEIGDLLGLLGLPVPALAGTEPERSVPVLHWPAPGLSTTTLCQGEPLTAADFAAAEAKVTCPECRTKRGPATTGPCPACGCSIEIHSPAGCRHCQCQRAGSFRSAPGA